MDIAAETLICSSIGVLEISYKYPVVTTYIFSQLLCFEYNDQDKEDKYQADNGDRAP